MSRRPVALGAVAIVVTAALVAAASLQARQTAVFRVGADNVPLFVTVHDKAGRLVPDLTRDAFRVTDNGKPQSVTTFDNSPQPIRLIVLIDVSGSMSGNLPLLRDACVALIARLDERDRARIGTFGESIAISPTFTRDEDELVAALPNAIPPNAPTPLWTAADQAIGSFGDADGRRVVLILSDGKDSGPRFGQKNVDGLDVLDRAQHEDVMVYGIGMRSRSATPMMPGARANLGQMLSADLPDPQLGRVAEDSGGGYLELVPHDDLGQTFARVLDELHHQYLLGFVPQQRDGKVHTVEVKTTGDGLKTRARKTYVAPK